LNQYTGAFFIGLNNTPVFSYDGKREINPQARQALEAYATLTLIQNQASGQKNTCES
jgi:hypothetical protein